SPLQIRTRAKLNGQLIGLAHPGAVRSAKARPLRAPGGENKSVQADQQQEENLRLHTLAQFHVLSPRPVAPRLCRTRTSEGNDLSVLAASRTESLIGNALGELL